MLTLAIGGVTDQAIKPMMILVQAPAGITSYVLGSRRAPLQTEGPEGRWGHERLIGCRATEPFH